MCKSKLISNLFPGSFYFAFATKSRGRKFSVLTTRDAEWKFCSLKKNGQSFSLAAFLPPLLTSLCVPKRFANKKEGRMLYIHKLYAVELLCCEVSVGNFFVSLSMSFALFSLLHAFLFSCSSEVNYTVLHNV